MFLISRNDKYSRNNMLGSDEIHGHKKKSKIAECSAYFVIDPFKNSLFQLSAANP